MAFLAAIPLSAWFSAAGSALTAVSGFAAQRYQAKVAEYNADIAEENAQRAESRAALEAQDNDMATLGLLGEQEAAQSSSGISLRSKSAVLTRRAARQLGRRDSLNIVQASKVEGYNYRVQAAGERANAKMARNASVGNLLGGFLAAGGSLIGNSKSTTKSFGSPSAYDPWEGMRRKTA